MANVVAVLAQRSNAAAFGLTVHSAGVETVAAISVAVIEEVVERVPQYWDKEIVELPRGSDAGHECTSIEILTNLGENLRKQSKRRPLDRQRKVGTCHCEDKEWRFNEK